jgi:peptidoglycan biosynthesis protein MviN/MurJ (putative lipid II flippase)
MTIKNQNKIMVGKILKAVRKEYTNIHQAALLLVIFSFVSQFVGLVRDRMLVSKLGPSLPLDIYYAAFKIPDIIFVSVASLVAVTAIMPFGKSVLRPAKMKQKYFCPTCFPLF